MLKDCPKYICFVVRIVTGIYDTSILDKRTDTEVNLPRTSLVWKRVPGHQITEADNDLGSNKANVFTRMN